MNKIMLIVKKRPSEMRLWQDCQWKRQACEKDDCPICGRINRDRKRHIDKGEDPDSMESVLFDVSNSFKEMIALLKKDAKRMGIDPDKEETAPEPKEISPTDYPIYNKIMEWRQGVYDIVEDSDETTDAWLYTEAGEDLMWYSSTLLVKIYRQLSTIKELESDDKEYLDLEYNYTGYVLWEVLNILDKALIELSSNGGINAPSFNIARLSFDAIKQEVSR